MLLMPALQIALTILVVLGTLRGDRQVKLIPIAALAAVAGACVFLPDQERQNYRFFVEHNIHPRAVWWSRQRPWMATIAISTWFIYVLISGFDPQDLSEVWNSIFSARSDNGPQSWGANRPLPPLGLTLVLAAVSYAAGQWTSMFVRSGLLAGFFGLLLALLLCGWVMSMNALVASWLTTVLPIPFVLLLATWLRAPDWVAENTTWPARCRAAAVVLVPAALIVSMAIRDRVNQYLDVPLNFDLAAYEAQMTDASRETANLYRRAGELYEKYPVAEGALFDHDDRNLSDAERAWLRDNAKPLDLLLEAGRRPDCTLDDPHTANDDFSFGNEGGLLTLLISSARELESEGELDKALERYFVALTIVSQWGQHAALNTRLNGVTYPAVRIFKEITQWGARSGQTAQRIEGAIERLQRHRRFAVALGRRAKVELHSHSARFAEWIR